MSGGRLVMVRVTMTAAAQPHTVCNHLLHMVSRHRSALPQF